MFRYGIQCALTELPLRMPAILRGSIQSVADTSAKLGYDAIELYISDPKKLDQNALIAAAKDNGLSYSGICTGLEFIFNNLCLTVDDAKTRTAAIDRLKEHLELGVALKCPIVIGTMRGNLPSAGRQEEYYERLSQALIQLDAYAANIGGELLVENINQYISNSLNTIEETGAFIRHLSLPRLKLHIDTHSMHIEDAHPYEAIRKHADILGYVHFSDSNRGYPGAGAIDFKSYYHALLDANYTGYIVAECQPYPTQWECGKRALTYMKHIEQASRIERLQMKE